MSSDLQQHVDQMHAVIKEILGNSVSDVFLQRIDGILNDCSSGKLSAAQACEKVQKAVALFIDENKAREIGIRCAPIIMRESAAPRK